MNWISNHYTVKVSTELSGKTLHPTLALALRPSLLLLHTVIFIRDLLFNYTVGATNDDDGGSSSEEEEEEEEEDAQLIEQYDRLSSSRSGRLVASVVVTAMTNLGS